MNEAAGVTRRELFRRVLIAASAGVVVSSAHAFASPQSRQRPAFTRTAWAWQFGEDGEPGDIRETLSQNHMGLLLKTHEGTSWMSRWDDSPQSIGGPAKVREVSSFFEQEGVPFHAWCVVEGEDPIREAQVCSEVLMNGARTLTLDLEPNEGGNYWQGGSKEALAFGQELRRLQPAAWITVAPDPRPWQLKEVPMAEFAGFSNEIAPQLYWRIYDSPANQKLLGQYGVSVSPEGLSPEDLLNMSQTTLGQYGLPIRPVGQGAADLTAWGRFVRHAFSLGMNGVSVWRYGTSDQSLWPFLRDLQSPATSAVQNAWGTHFGWAR